ncbi:hypothetical protein L596_010382 [Steinernema carpocapsae]|uniref:Uncharacterized protein n=1 Tax=Steinernema carpocapsae TaxID=34508 RepID=A0A4U5PID8_STECR|nr:hypothetical protein L596_010382 [Steinernema carpocapsae]
MAAAVVASVGVYDQGGYGLFFPGAIHRRQSRQHIIRRPDDSVSRTVYRQRRGEDERGRVSTCIRAPVRAYTATHTHPSPPMTRRDTFTAIGARVLCPSFLICICTNPLSYRGGGRGEREEGIQQTNANATVC